MKVPFNRIGLTNRFPSPLPQDKHILNKATKPSRWVAVRSIKKKYHKCTTPCIYRIKRNGEVLKIGKAWKGLFVRYNAGYAPILNALLECGCATLEVRLFHRKSARFVRAREVEELNAHEKAHGRRPRYSPKL